jgi:hypothetical protein
MEYTKFLQFISSFLFNILNNKYIFLLFFTMLVPIEIMRITCCDKFKVESQFELLDGVRSLETIISYVDKFEIYT